MPQISTCLRHAPFLFMAAIYVTCQIGLFIVDYVIISGVLSLASELNLYLMGRAGRERCKFENRWQRLTTFTTFVPGRTAPGADGHAQVLEVIQ